MRKAKLVASLTAAFGAGMIVEVILVLRLVREQDKKIAKLREANKELFRIVELFPHHVSAEALTKVLQELEFAHELNNL